jgi:hypothetical protein
MRAGERNFCDPRSSLSVGGSFPSAFDTAGQGDIGFYAAPPNMSVLLEEIGARTNRNSAGKRPYFVIIMQYCRLRIET